MPAAPAFPPPPTCVPVRRALISVSDKTGLIETAQALAGARRRAGLHRRHPRGHRRRRPAGEGRLRAHRLSGDDGRAGQDPAPGGPRRPARRARRARARRGDGRARHRRHRPALREPLPVRGRPWPRGADFDDCVENIDIGGPAMIRSAAKNHAYVAVCTDAGGHGRGAGGAEGRRRHARWRCAGAWPPAPIARTAAYDAAISTWFAGQVGDDWPARKSIAGAAGADHALRREPAPGAPPSTRFAEPAPRRRHRPPAAGQGAQLQQHQRHRRGVRAGRRVRSRRPAPPCAIIKHANPCGVALGADLKSAYRAGAAVRSGLGLRRHRRGEPPARRGGRRARSSRSSPRW